MQNYIKIVAIVMSLMPLSMQGDIQNHLLMMEENIVATAEYDVPFDQTQAYRAIVDAINQRPYRALNNCAAHCLYALMTAHIALGSYFVASTILGQQ